MNWVPVGAARLTLDPRTRKPIIPCRLGAGPRLDLDAFFDTGADLSVLRADVVSALPPGSVEETGMIRSQSARGERYDGPVVRCSIELTADLHGDGLRVDCSFLVVGPEFPFEVVLGVDGFLDRAAVAWIPALTSRGDGAFGMLLFGRPHDDP